MAIKFSSGKTYPLFSALQSLFLGGEVFFLRGKWYPSF